MLFHNLSLEAFCHETEDPKLVKDAFSVLVPFEIDSTSFVNQEFDGSFGNRITLIRLVFEKQSDMRAIIKHLQKNISDNISDFDIPDHITDDRMFWIRFDKQKAFENKICLGGEDTIQLKGKIAAFPAKRERAIEVMNDAWGGKFN